MNDHITAAEYRRDVLGLPASIAGVPLPDALAGCRPGSLADQHRWDDEEDFRAFLEREARRNGWLAYHVHDARRSRAGFPDLIIARAKPLEDRGDLVFAWEAKTMQGLATPQQMDWLRVLDASFDARIVRPCHAEWCVAKLRGDFKAVLAAPSAPFLVRELDDNGRVAR